jgi:hypothetical protein
MHNIRIENAHVWTGNVTNYWNSKSFVPFRVQVKAVITALVASFSAYEGHTNARKAETEEYRRLNNGKLTPGLS